MIGAALFGGSDKPPEPLTISMVGGGGGTSNVNVASGDTAPGLNNPFSKFVQAAASGGYPPYTITFYEVTGNKVRMVDRGDGVCYARFSGMNVGEYQSTTMDAGVRDSRGKTAYTSEAQRRVIGINRTS